MKLIISVLMVLQFQCVRGAGSGILHFVNFTILLGTDQGVCCSDCQQSECPGQCDVHLNICIGEISPDRNCLYGQGTFNFHMEETTEMISLEEIQGSIPNPFVYRFDAWKVGVSVDVDILVGESMLIDTITLYLLDNPQHNGQVYKVGPHLYSGNITGLVVTHSEACDPYHFGDCSVLCMPDPALYTCDPDGNKQCLPGIDCRFEVTTDQTTLTPTGTIEVTDSQTSLSSDILDSSVDSSSFSEHSQTSAGPPSVSATVSTSYTGSLKESSTTTVDKTVEETSHSSNVNENIVPTDRPLISSPEVDVASPQQYSDSTVGYVSDSATPEVDTTDSQEMSTAWETTTDGETRTEEEVSNSLVDGSTETTVYTVTDTETTLDTITDVPRVDNSVSTTTPSAVDSSTLTVPHICTGHVGVSGENVGMLEATVTQHATDNSLDIASFSSSSNPEHSVNDLTSFTTTALPGASSNQDTSESSTSYTDSEPDSNTLNTDTVITTSSNDRNLSTKTSTVNSYVPTDVNQAKNVTSSASVLISHQTTEDVRSGETESMQSVTASRILSTLALQSSTVSNSPIPLVNESVVEASTESAATGAASTSQLSSGGGGPYTMEATTSEHFVSKAESSSSNSKFTSTIQSVVSNSAFTSTKQSAVSNFEFTSTKQTDVSNFEFTSTKQTDVSSSEFTSTKQTAVSNFEFTSTEQSAVSNSEFTPSKQSAVSHSKFTPTTQSSTSRNEFSPTIQTAVSKYIVTITKEAPTTEASDPTKHGTTSLNQSYSSTTENPSNIHLKTSKAVTSVTENSPANSIFTKQSVVSSTESSSFDLETTTADTTSTIRTTEGTLPTRKNINESVTKETTLHQITSTITPNLSHTPKKNDTVHAPTTSRLPNIATGKTDDLKSPTTYPTTEPSVTVNYSSINALSTSANIPTNKVTKIVPVRTEIFSQYSSPTSVTVTTTTSRTKTETDSPTKQETHPSIRNTVSTGKASSSTRIPTTKQTIPFGPSTIPPRPSSCTAVVVYPGRGKPVLSVQFAGGQQAVSVVSIEKEVVDLLVSAGYKVDTGMVKAIQSYYGGMTIVNVTIDSADLALGTAALADVGDKLCKEASVFLKQPSFPVRTADTDVDSAVIAGIVVLVAYLTTLFIIAVILVRRKYRDRNRVSGRPMSEVSKVTRTTEHLLDRPETGMTGLSSQYEESIC